MVVRKTGTSESDKAEFESLNSSLTSYVTGFLTCPSLSFPTYKNEILLNYMIKLVFLPHDSYAINVTFILPTSFQSIWIVFSKNFTGFRLTMSLNYDILLVSHQTIFRNVNVWSSKLLFSCSVVSDCFQPLDCSMPGSSVLHYLLEFAHIYIHWVCDAIQPSHPLSPPFSSCLTSK